MKRVLQQIMKQVAEKQCRRMRFDASIPSMRNVSSYNERAAQRGVCRPRIQRSRSCLELAQRLIFANDFTITPFVTRGRFHVPHFQRNTHAKEP